MKLFQRTLPLSFITPHSHLLPYPPITSSTRRSITKPNISKMASSNNNNESTTNNELILKERAKSTFRYTESIAPGLEFEMSLHSILHTSLSEFQEVQVIDSYFGRTLVTDGKTQSAEHDEFVYHESLVHPALFWSAILSNSEKSGGVSRGGGAPKSVFIGGGGELATAREVLKHNTIERLVMVDIDPEVIEVCKKYMPEWGGDAVVNHPKMELIVGDAHKYLMETNETFDVIIMDISDPIEAGPGIALYTQEFYKRAAEVLDKNHGVFVTQAGSADFVPHPHAFPTSSNEDNTESSCFSPIMNTLATVFDHAIPYSVPMPSFGEDWGFVMAFNNNGPAAAEKGGDAAAAMRNKLVDLSSETINQMIEERIELVPGVPEHRFRSVGVIRATTGKERGGDVLKHYDGEGHRGLFALSKPLREAIKSDKRIMTAENPIFMY